MKLTAEQKVQRAHVWLMKHPNYCLYSGVIMLGKVEVSEDAPTACTNGRDTFYGREFINSLRDAEIRALVLHENLHKAFRHLIIWRHLFKQNPQIANMACDYVINLMIDESDKSGRDVRLPDRALLDPKYKGWDAQRVFNDLEQQAKNGSINVKTKGNQKGEDMPVVSVPALDEHDWEAAEGLSDAEKAQLEKAIDQALRQGKMLATRLGGGVPREILDTLTPTVDWRAVMREFISSTCSGRDESTWRRPSRRWVSQDIYMPSLISESMGRIVVAIDTSGSIANDELGAFLGELRSICESVKPEGLDLLYWDTKVAQHEKYDVGGFDSLLTITRPKGGGGTNPSCITAYMREHKSIPECAVILTDGDVGGDWGGEWPCPTLWGITGEAVSPVGKSVRILI